MSEATNCIDGGQVPHGSELAEPLVSVIVPVYNTREYLPQCLDSALSQCGGSVEVICVDDGSTDGGLEYLRERSREDARITVMCQEHKGAGAARNCGIECARGRFYHFLDSDDYLERDILDESIALMDERAADILVFQVLQHNMSNGRQSIARNAFREENFPAETFAPSEISERLFNTFLSWAHNKVFRADFVQQKALRFQEIHRTNDLFFTYSALFNASVITVLPKVGLHYRANQASSSQGTNSLYPLDFYKAFAELRTALVGSGHWEQYRSSFLNEAVHSTMYNLRSQKDPDAFDRLYEFMKTEGFSLLGVGEICADDFFYKDDYERYLTMMDTTMHELARLGWERLDKESTFSKNLAKLKKNQQSVERLKASAAYRVGRAMTSAPRALKRLAKKSTRRN